MRRDEARLSFEKALAFMPGHTDTAIRFLAETLAVKGFATAEEAFRRIARSNPDPALRRGWARIAFEGGDTSLSPAEGAIVSGQRSARSWVEANGGSVTLIGAPAESPVEFPPVVGIPPVSYLATVVSNQPYLAELEDVTVFFRSNIILTRDGAALNELGTHPKFGPYVSHQSDSLVIGQRDSSLLLDAGSFEIDDLDTGIMLCGAASNEFGHWVCDFLPRLEVYERYPNFSEIPIIVDENMPSSHYDYLRCIAPANRIVRIGPGHGLRCRKLVFAPPVTFFPVHMLPHPFRSDEIVSMLPSSRLYLRRRVEAYLGAGSPTGKKLYLSRRNMTWRRLSNDAEVSEFLERHGFETVSVETLTFEEQVRVYQSASSIVAPNGGSLLNVIFADPSVKLLVLSSPNLHDLPCFYGQMVPLGYRPLFVCGEALGDPNEKHTDYIVPLETLDQALRLIGAS
jgi:hypothetical protein